MLPPFSSSSWLGFSFCCCLSSSAAGLPVFFVFLFCEVRRTHTSEECIALLLRAGVISSAEVCVCDEGGRRAKRERSSSDLAPRHSQRPYRLSSLSLQHSTPKNIYRHASDVVGTDERARTTICLDTLYMQGGHIFSAKRSSSIFFFFGCCGDNHLRYFWLEKKSVFLFRSIGYDRDVSKVLLCSRRHQ